jgi:hypothetical protein
MYSADGKFLRNVTPPDLSGAFAATAAWSPDGSLLTFAGRKSMKPQPTPAAPDLLPQGVSSPAPAPSVAPAFGQVQTFNTEQVYIGARDTFDLRPLTNREGLIYFNFSWAPDGHALAALACKEGEWDAREKDYKMPAGRPRLIFLDGRERLLSDGLTEAAPVWSPDASKVATAFESDVAIYDALTDSPTGARITLREPLVAASAAYDESKLRTKSKKSGEGGESQHPAPSSAPPVSFNPIVRLAWPRPETLYFKTAFVRTYPSDLVNNFQRWHVLHLSPQATLLSGKGTAVHSRG